MNGPFETLASLDKLIHEPARLAILTALSACSSADFLFLQRLTGLNKGNLSSHLDKLEQAGLIAIKKDFVGRTARTRVSIMPDGKTQIDAHWAALEQVRREVSDWRPALDTSG